MEASLLSRINLVYLSLRFCCRVGLVRRVTSVLVRLGGTTIVKPDQPCHFDGLMAHDARVTGQRNIVAAREKGGHPRVCGRRAVLSPLGCRVWGRCSDLHRELGGPAFNFHPASTPADGGDGTNYCRIHESPISCY